MKLGLYNEYFLTMRKLMVLCFSTRASEPRLMSIKYHSNSEVLDWCLIDGDLMVFAIQEATLLSMCTCISNYWRNKAQIYIGNQQRSVSNNVPANSIQILWKILLLLTLLELEWDNSGRTRSMFCLTRPSTATVLTLYDKCALVCQEDSSQLPALSQCWEMIENTNIC